MSKSSLKSSVALTYRSQFAVRSIQPLLKLFRLTRHHLLVYAAFTSSIFYSSPSATAMSNQQIRHLQTRVNLHALAPVTSSSVRMSLTSRSGSPNRSMAAMNRKDQVVRKQNGYNNPLKNIPKKTCMCSPTTHPGSFRCSLHKNYNSTQAMTYRLNRLNRVRSALTNFVVRIGTVERLEIWLRALAR
ncbi:hypothetical protein Tco_0858833 [Tanacetum coccineum]|uniref:Uncharacterized protein n=1 Tax=Tanacetum coccineum TaxID=301880 RepID=A0ABQ5BE20_9ASTR